MKTFFLFYHFMKLLDWVVQRNIPLLNSSHLVSIICLLCFLIQLEIYCPALEAPFRGHITPETCTDKRENIRRNTVCTYGCESAHYISGGDPALECQINGFWNGIPPYCKRKWCFAVVLKAKCLSKVMVYFNHNTFM